MCGIAALFAYGADAAPLRREEADAITARMFARGPDSGGVWISADARAALGSRRLAIIDPTPEGAQPMFSADGTLGIVFNGEIYNHRELRERLVRRGARFHSTTDTEVLLESYRQYGEEMVGLLRGMFAFAIWDAPKRRMFLARDPYGIKPLYYADDGRTFRCASQVRALLAGGAIPRTRDAAGVAGFLLLGSVPEPFTTFASIRSVEAGTSFFVGEGGRTEARRFFSIAALFERAVEQKPVARLTTPEILLRELAGESVTHHLVSDVPVGMFLSAGIDSATLAALALERSGDPIESVTIVFDVYRGQSFDESAEAGRFARERGSPHTTRVVTREEFLADLPRFFDAMDQPTIDGVNTWFVSKAAAERRLKVALSGVGGDELFGSYPSFRSLPRIVRATRAARRIPGGKGALDAAIRLGSRNPKAAAVSEQGLTYAGAYLLRRGLFLAEELPRAVAEEGLPRLGIESHLTRALEPDPATPFGTVATLEASFYMRNQLLRDTDWASMAHSLEVRTPLVDAFLLRQLAPLLLAYGDRCKRFFAASPLSPLPPALTQRRKTGFQTPIGEWLGLPHDGTSTRMRSWARMVLERYAG